MRSSCARVRRSGGGEGGDTGRSTEVRSRRPGPGGDPAARKIPKLTTSASSAARTAATAAPATVSADLVETLRTGMSRT